jgi:hypothetical protein
MGSVAVLADCMDVCLEVLTNEKSWDKIADNEECE